jgi:excinuclease ABC subunit C
MALTSRIIANLPRSTGVYLMRNNAGEIIYIGKAKDLRSRVHAYLGQDTRPNVPFIAAQTEKVDFIITGKEKEALFLENQLIKAHKPRFNIDLKDGKTYVRIRLSTDEPWPRVSVTRRVLNDGARYFGPYSSAQATRRTLSAVGRVFPLRRCTDTVFKNRIRPCMYHQIGLCSGPCAGRVSREDYAQIVGDLIAFLEGRNQDLERRLTERMKRASEMQNYEQAAKIRDQIAAVRDTLATQALLGNTRTDTDIFAAYRFKDQVQIAVLHITRGLVSDSRSFVVKNTEEDGFEANCILQFYLQGRDVPRVIYSDFVTDDVEELEQVLSDLRGSKVSIRQALRGKPRQWMEMARENARSYGRRPETSVLDDIAQHFHLPSTAYRIECYDISSFQGSHPTASRAVFIGGEPDKSLYRHYRIRDIEGQDDFAMMEQVLTRRFTGDDSRPDLLVIDGGKGQLGVCVRVLESLGLSHIPVVAMAKARGASKDRFFLPGRKDAVHLEARSQALKTLQRIRDEAHRFAVSYHKKLRSKSMGTYLESIPGIGPKKARSILMHTSRAADPAQLRPEDLEGCPALTGKDVERVISFIRDRKR